MSESQGPRKLPEFRKPEQSGSPQKTFNSLGILLVLVCLVFLTIFWGIGWLAREDLTTSELYSRSLDGRQDSKRMAAIEWGRRLHLYESRGQNSDVTRLSPDPLQSKRLAEIVRASLKFGGSNAEQVDAIYLGGLVTVIGFSRFAPPALQDLEALLAEIPVREWTELQIPILLALARLQTPVSKVSEERLLKVLSEEDPALRKTAVFTVGVLAQSSESRDFFRARVLELCSDPVSDVRWNSGFTLGRWRDPQAQPVLKELVDLAGRVRRDGHIDGEESGVLTESLLLSMDQAFRLIGESPDSELAQKLAVISREHPHLKIRQAAISALKTR
jgi:hypothetical protein